MHTDHNLLNYILNRADAKEKLAHPWLHLSKFDFIIVYWFGAETHETKTLSFLETSEVHEIYSGHLLDLPLRIVVTICDAPNIYEGRTANDQWATTPSCKGKYMKEATDILSEKAGNPENVSLNQTCQR